MPSIQLVLPIFRDLDGATLSARTFSEACIASGWPEPVDDGVGLWEVEHPTERTYLVLDTSTKPTTLIGRLEQDDEYDPDEMLEDDELRRRFDERFEQALAALRSCFPLALTEGTYEKPYKWRFAHFQGLNSVIALEQSDYDPQYGVQLVLLLQPLPRKPHRSAITSKW
ncbi:hypothetical protein [Peristeroidobacter agariperforans]|uniref:hypothetical protein n=1 Tax=Peristeroidobacter agariperforans TaxID=268404 RepID=UPI00101C1C3F|nr:hypothetical protein [Peristeroidobacter agariperforans]